MVTPFFKKHTHTHTHSHKPTHTHTETDTHTHIDTHTHTHTHAKLSSPLSREDLKKKLYANSKKYFHKYQTLDILSVLQVVV